MANIPKDLFDAFEDFQASDMAMTLGNNISQMVGRFEESRQAVADLMPKFDMPKPLADVGAKTVAMPESPLLPLDPFAADSNPQQASAYNPIPYSPPPQLAPEYPQTGDAIDRAGTALDGGSGNSNVRRHSDLIAEASAKYGVPASVIAGIMEIESGGEHYRPDGTVKYSPAGAVGLMQVMPGIHGLSAEELGDPRTNVMKGAQILADNYRATGNWDHAAAKYFGAFSNGQVTEASDGGTTGSGYVSKFAQARANYVDVGGSAAPSKSIAMIREGVGSDELYPNQMETGELSTAEAIAACGIVAAMAFARANGRNPTATEAKEAAERFGRWTAEAGMGGPQGFVNTIREKWGIAASAVAPVLEKIKADVLAGNPVVLSSPGSSGHYWVVSGVDQNTGKLQVGESGEVVGTSHWVSWEEIQANPYGKIDTAIHLDNPASSGLSVANKDMDAGAYDGEDPEETNRRLLSELQSGRKPTISNYQFDPFNRNDDNFTTLGYDTNRDYGGTQTADINANTPPADFRPLGSPFGNPLDKVGEMLKEAGAKVDELATGAREAIMGSGITKRATERAMDPTNPLNAGDVMDLQTEGAYAAAKGLYEAGGPTMTDAARAGGTNALAPLQNTPLAGMAEMDEGQKERSGPGSAIYSIMGAGGQAAVAGALGAAKGAAPKLAAAALDITEPIGMIGDAARAIPNPGQVADEAVGIIKSADGVVQQPRKIKVAPPPSETFNDMAAHTAEFEGGTWLPGEAWNKLTPERGGYVVGGGGHADVLADTAPTPETMAEAVNRTEAWKDAAPNKTWGTWYGPDKSLYIDYGDLVDDLDEAVTLAARRGQQAIWDNGESKVVDIMDQTTSDKMKALLKQGVDPEDAMRQAGYRPTASQIDESDGTLDLDGLARKDEPRGTRPDGTEVFKNDPDAPAVGESPMDYWRRTGNAPRIAGGMMESPTPNDPKANALWEFFDRGTNEANIAKRFNLPLGDVKKWVKEAKKAGQQRDPAVRALAATLNKEESKIKFPYFSRTKGTLEYTDSGPEWERMGELDDAMERGEILGWRRGDVDDAIEYRGGGRPRFYIPDLVIQRADGSVHIEEIKSTQYRGFATNILKERHLGALEANVEYELDPKLFYYGLRGDKANKRVTFSVVDEYGHPDKQPISVSALDPERAQYLTPEAREQLVHSINMNKPRDLSGKSTEEMMSQQVVNRFRANMELPETRGWNSNAAAGMEGQNLRYDQELGRRGFRQMGPPRIDTDALERYPVEAATASYKAGSAKPGAFYSERLGTTGNVLPPYPHPMVSAVDQYAAETGRALPVTPADVEAARLGDPRQQTPPIDLRKPVDRPVGPDDFPHQDLETYVRELENAVCYG